MIGGFSFVGGSAKGNAKRMIATMAGGEQWGMMQIVGK